MTDPVRDKNFYLYRILESDPAWRVVREVPALEDLQLAYRQRLLQAKQHCASSSSCYISAARLTDAEIVTAQTALAQLYDTDQTVQGSAVRLRESGTMVLSNKLSDRGLLTETWRLYALSINRILAVYGGGVPPMEGEIDAMSLNPRSERFASLLRTAFQIVLEKDPNQRIFLSDPIEIATLLLSINGRDEASRYEPLEQGENQLALEQVAVTDWGKYRYPLILVPGAGPDQEGVPLSPASALRLALAVSRYRSGLAPFILVSGGFVHPPHTPYCEAIEMKRALVETYHIPAAAIFVDPYARHTTSNIRNAARILYRYRMPLDVPSLIVTDQDQVDGIMDPSFDAGVVKEINTRPYITKRQISPVEIEFLPSIDALQTNWLDPLDP